MKPMREAQIPDFVHALLAIAAISVRSEILITSLATSKRRRRLVGR